MGRTLSNMSDAASPLEDWRGVDVGQIRDQLRLSVKDRVRVMVRAANIFLNVQERVVRARSAESR